MPPALISAPLERRYVEECVNGFCRRRSGWFDWGRWIVLGVIVFVVLAVAFSCSRGAQPMYGTGWMAPGGKFGDNQQMNNYQQGYPQQGYGQQGYPPPPPAYGQPQHTGTTFNPNDGYYGDQSQHPQQYGVQQPPNAYQRESAYAPPPGPPPGK